MKAVKVLWLLVAALFASLLVVPVKADESRFAYFKGITNSIAAATTNTPSATDIIFGDAAEGAPTNGRIVFVHGVSDSDATGASAIKLQMNRIFKKQDGTLIVDTDNDSALLVSFTPGGATATQRSSNITWGVCYGLRASSLISTNASGAVSNALFGATWNKSITTDRILGR